MQNIEINKAEQTLAKEKNNLAKEKNNLDLSIKLNSRFYLETLLKEERSRLANSESRSEDYLRALESTEQQIVQTIDHELQKGNSNEYER